MATFLNKFLRLAVLWLSCQCGCHVFATKRLSAQVNDQHMPTESQYPFLTFDFYSKSCPRLHAIVEERVAFYSSQDPTTPAPLLRLFFHDCFVQGCDGSVLLNSSKTNVAEKDAAINFSLSNFNIIDDIKERLEKACPETVSCADVLAVTAVYSVKQAGGPLYEIELGRRDALTSYADSSEIDLPAFSLHVSGLLESFENVGLDILDLVTLSGAHTIGQGHCQSIKDRLYPKVDSAYQNSLGQQLLSNCTDDGALHAPNFDANVQFFNDQITPLIFDNKYFVDLKTKKGMFTSDKSLFFDTRTSALVDYYSSNQEAFFKQFGISLRKMGSINVLTGTKGQIRKKCWVRNSGNADPAFNPSK